MLLIDRFLKLHLPHTHRHLSRTTPIHCTLLQLPLPPYHRRQCHLHSETSSTSTCLNRTTGPLSLLPRRPSALFSRSNLALPRKNSRFREMTRVRLEVLVEFFDFAGGVR